MNWPLILTLTAFFVITDVGHSGLKLAEVRRDVIVNRSVMAVGAVGILATLLVYLYLINHVKI